MEDELIKRAEEKFKEYEEACSEIAKEAQKRINWSDEVDCEYFLFNGLCVYVNYNSYSYICPVRKFFEKAGDGKMSKEDFISIST